MGTASYTPREDSGGRLIIEPHLLALALQWAEQTDAAGKGVPLTRFHRALGLPSKAHSVHLRDALRLHGLIRREVREGWYRLLTVEEAVRAGKLPSGPWHTPPPLPNTAPNIAAEPAHPPTLHVEPSLLPALSANIGEPEADADAACITADDEVRA